MSTRTALSADLHRLAATPRLLVALDFDGTLAPIVDEPAAARALPETREALLALAAAPDTVVALVSGRALGSLEEVSQVPEEQVLLVGSHGAEFRVPGPDIDVGLSDEESARLTSLGVLLEAEAEPVPGAWIEGKPVGFALHTRKVAPDAASELQRRAVAVTGAIEGLTVRRGKDVLEFSVRAATKGDGIEVLRRRVEATAVLYAGDDVTDEDAFAVLGDDDLGIKVGPGETAARRRVDSCEEMAVLLTDLAALRRS